MNHLYNRRWGGEASLITHAKQYIEICLWPVDIAEMCVQVFWSDPQLAFT